MDKETLALQVEIWKKTVEVQQHFNEIGLKIRQLAITFLAAVGGAVGFSLDRKIEIPLWETKISLAAILLGIAFIIWCIFWMMDRLWYHRLLYGAVRHGLRVEKVLTTEGLEASLTDAIGKESPIFIGNRKIRSPNKIDLLYYIIGCLIILSASVFINGILTSGIILVSIGGLIGFFFSFERVN